MLLSQRPLNILILVGLTLVQSACVTTPSYEPPEDENASPRTSRSRSKSAPRSSDNLETQLGMNRSPTDLGYAEKSFNPCNYGTSNICNFKYMTVVNFQLLCRDTEGTVSQVPRYLSPITHPNILWTLAGQSGGLPTDRNGYGSLKVITDNTTRGKRLVLKKGTNYVGLDVSEASKIVLPKNWCDPS